MVKGNKTRTLYLDFPSKWRKVPLFVLVVDLSFRKLEKYYIISLGKYPNNHLEKYICLKKM
jgi:hypothetical protein